MKANALVNKVEGQHYNAEASVYKPLLNKSNGNATMSPTDLPVSMRNALVFLLI